MQNIIFSALIFLTPLFFATFTSNFFSTPKQLIFLIAILLLLIYRAFQIFTTKTLKLSTSPLRFALLSFAFAIILNIALNPIARLEAIAGPGILYLSLCIWAYFLSQDDSHKLKTNILYAVVGGGSILALHTLAQLTFLYKSTFIPTFMQSRAFTLTGNVMTTLIVLAIVASLSAYLTFKNREYKILFSISTIISTIATIALGAILLPGGELALNLLPMRASWSIALDAMKSPRSFFLGIGLTNFPNFYSTVKPLFLNTTAFWNTIPGSSSSELLQIMTTTGMLGLLSFISIPLLMIKHPRSTDQSIGGLKIVAALSFLALFLTPGSIPVLLLLFTSVALLSSRDPSTKELTFPANVLLSLAILSLVGVTSYFASKIIMAESSLRKAQIALTTNDGKSLYENSLKAVQLVPQMASYRLSYAQVNLSLATALSQKESLSDTERTNVSQLISQAVREGKSAVSLSPSNSIAWQNLGNIYQKLINVGEGADKFALEAYAQAVTLDPGSPALRIEYGGLLYQLAGLSKDPVEQANLFGIVQ